MNIAIKMKACRHCSAFVYTLPIFHNINFSSCCYVCEFHSIWYLDGTIIFMSNKHYFLIVLWAMCVFNLDDSSFLKPGFKACTTSCITQFNWCGNMEFVWLSKKRRIIPKNMNFYSNGKNHKFDFACNLSCFVIWSWRIWYVAFHVTFTSKSAHLVLTNIG